MNTRFTAIALLLGATCSTIACGSGSTNGSGGNSGATSTGAGGGTPSTGSNTGTSDASSTGNTSTSAGITCAGDETLCPKGCLNLTNDVNNCGSCGYSCPPVAGGTPTCKDSKCEFECNSGFTYCDVMVGPTMGPACVDTMKDDYNCGGCNHSCNGDGTCMNGQCL